MWKELKFNIDAKAHERCARRSGNKRRRPQDEIESMTMTNDTKVKLTQGSLNLAVCLPWQR